ncbi:hypothetical protein BHM03_00050185, partial [Ensete ventricosum]
PRFVNQWSPWKMCSCLWTPIGIFCTKTLHLECGYRNDRRRSSLGIGPGSDDVVGPRREFTRRFAKGIEKFVGNTP